MDIERPQSGNIEVGDVTGSIGVAIGHDASATVNQAFGAEAIRAVFGPTYRAIDDRPEDPNLEKQELTDAVKKIEAEAAKGEDANPAKVDRWLGFVAAMAPDIWEVLTATIVNPAAGVGMVVRKVAERARQGRSPAG